MELTKIPVRLSTAQIRKIKMGGAIGLTMVYILTLILSGPLDFPVYVSLPLLISTVIICLVVGILAGIFPASRAAKMDPVEAIRSK